MSHSLYFSYELSKSFHVLPKYGVSSLAIERLVREGFLSAADGLLPAILLEAKEKRGGSWEQPGRLEPLPENPDCCFGCITVCVVNSIITSNILVQFTPSHILFYKALEVSIWLPSEWKLL